ncbi:MAG: ECF transporter S component [Herbinix sp.]|nr:ECF transporter S component [Herbinix sp.]
MKTNTITNQNKTIFKTKQMVMISLFAALSYVLMFVKLPYKHLGFLEFEFSDIPAVIATLQFGPLAGIVIELIKNLIKGITATTSAGVGEFANFIVSSAFLLPIGFLYKLRNTKNTEKNKVDNSKTWNAVYMIIIFGVGVISMTIMGALLNYFVVIPVYAKLFGGMENVIGFAAANVPAIKDLASLVIIGITPFNIVKGITISIVGYYTYRLLKGRLL